MRQYFCGGTNYNPFGRIRFCSWDYIFEAVQTAILLRAGRIKFWSWDCISVGAQTQFLWPRITRTRDGERCEALNTGPSCLLSSGPILWKNQSFMRIGFTPPMEMRSHDSNHISYTWKMKWALLLQLVRIEVRKKVI